MTLSRQLKPKPCKAADCPEVFTPASGFQKVCSWQCGLALTREEAARKKARQDKQEAKERKDNDLKHQLELTQSAFNGMIRALDGLMDCVSCKKPWMTYALTCGHFLTVGAHPELRFDARNAHGQCSGCNCGKQKHHKGDNKSTRQKFEAELDWRYGPEFLSWLKGPHEIKQYRCEELREMRKEFNAETRRLQKGLPPTRDWREV